MRFKAFKRSASQTLFLTCVCQSHQELGGIFHFPYSKRGPTIGLQTVLSTRGTEHQPIEYDIYLSSHLLQQTRIVTAAAARASSHGPNHFRPALRLNVSMNECSFQELLVQRSLNLQITLAITCAVARLYSVLSWPRVSR
jgi:hypothetical protein